jgi:hypothetical protein
MLYTATEPRRTSSYTAATMPTGATPRTPPVEPHRSRSGPGLSRTRWARSAGALATATAGSTSGGASSSRGGEEVAGIVRRRRGTARCDSMGRRPGPAADGAADVRCAGRPAAAWGPGQVHVRLVPRLRRVHRRRARLRRSCGGCIGSGQAGPCSRPASGNFEKGARLRETSPRSVRRDATDARTGSRPAPHNGSGTTSVSRR